MLSVGKQAYVVQVQPRLLVHLQAHKTLIASTYSIHLGA